MLTRVEITNYKCLANVVVDLTPLHAVVGPNDTGKSSFLEAICALVNFKKKAEFAPFPPGWDGRELVSHGSDADSITIQGTFRPSDGGNEITISQKVSFPSEGKGISGGPLFDPDNERAREFRENLGSAALFRFDPHELASPAGVSAGQAFALDESGHGLPMLLDDILSNNREGFIALEKEFCDQFPRYSRIILTRSPAKEKKQRPDGLFNYDDTPGKTLWFLSSDEKHKTRAAQASDGTLVLLALLALGYLTDPPSIILIEEPENSIHPKLLGEVVSILRKIATKAQTDHGPQVVVSSHSPYLLDYLEPEEVTLFTRDPNGQTKTLRMADSERVRWELKHFHLGEIWTAEGEEKLFALAEKESAT